MICLVSAGTDWVFIINFHNDNWKAHIQILILISFYQAVVSNNASYKWSHVEMVKFCGFQYAPVLFPKVA